MKPYYADASVTIYHGDARDIMPTIRGGDLVLTDPPYGISYQTAWRSGTDPLRKKIANDASLDVVGQVWPLAMAALNEDRHWYAFASPRKIADAERVFLGAKHILAWDKGDRGTVGDLTCGFGEAWEAIFYGMKGRRELRGKRPRTVVRHDWSGAMDPVHPTVKPVGLLIRLIEWSTDAGELVIDPFMGSGTTLRAAKDIGRRAIGVELDERYCEVAAQRCSQETLFADQLQTQRAAA